MAHLLRAAAAVLLLGGIVAAAVSWPDRSLGGLTEAEIADCRGDARVARVLGRPQPACMAFVPRFGEPAIAPIQYVLPLWYVGSSAALALLLFGLARLTQQIDGLAPLRPTGPHHDT